MTERAKDEWHGGDTGGRSGEAVPAGSAGGYGVAACAGAVCPVAAERAARGEDGDVLGAEGRFAGGKTGGGAGTDRPERGWEDDAAEDIVPDYAAHGGLGGDTGAGAQLAGGGDGLSSGTDGARERVLVRSDPGDGEKGDRPEIRSDRGVCGDREVYRYAGEALFKRDVYEAGIFGGGAPGAGDIAGGRSAGGGGHKFSEEVPRKDGRGGESGADGSAGEPPAEPDSQIVPTSGVG